MLQKRDSFKKVFLKMPIGSIREVHCFVQGLNEQEIARKIINIFRKKSEGIVIKAFWEDKQEIIVSFEWLERLGEVIRTSFFWLWSYGIWFCGLKKIRPQDLVVATCGLNTEVSVRGRLECGVSTAQPNEGGRSENGENLSRGIHWTWFFFQKSGRVNLRIDRVHIKVVVRRWDLGEWVVFEGICSLCRRS